MVPYFLNLLTLLLVKMVNIKLDCLKILPDADPLMTNAFQSLTSVMENETAKMEVTNLILAVSSYQTEKNRQTDKQKDTT